jgi:hypothetical protein
VSIAPTIGITPHVAPYALYIDERVLGDNWVMGVFKYRPFALVNVVAFLVFEMLAGLEVTIMTEIFSRF